MTNIASFTELLNKGPDSWNKAVYGDKSALAQLLQRAPGVGCNDLSKALCDFRTGGDLADTSRHVIEGLAKTLRAVEAIRGGNKSASTLLEQAIQSFEEAWCNAEPKEVRAAVSNTRQIQEAFAAINSAHAATAYWIVYDLVDRWYQTHNHQPLVSQSAATPLLGAIADQAGAVFRLTVELFVSPQGVLCPDPLYLGLTEITNADRGLHASMQKIWTASQLGSRLRGRWRIENAPPRENTTSTVFYPKALAGRSAEAATMCGLLAASGDPYWERPTEKLSVPNPLDMKVAISATVDSDSPRPQNYRGPVDLKLGTVAKIPEKLKSAYPVVDTVLFVPDELKKTAADSAKANEPTFEPREVDQIRDEERACQEAGKSYGGIHIAEASTIEQALDLMLVTNRHLARYQRTIRNQWLSQWEGDTGKAGSDKAPWTEQERS